MTSDKTKYIQPRYVLKLGLDHLRGGLVLTKDDFELRYVLPEGGEVTLAQIEGVLNRVFLNTPSLDGAVSDACADLQELLTGLDEVEPEPTAQELLAALQHALGRNHEPNPRACEGCRLASRALDYYIKQLEEQGESAPWPAANPLNPSDPPEHVDAEALAKKHGVPCTWIRRLTQKDLEIIQDVVNTFRGIGDGTVPMYKQRRLLTEREWKEAIGDCAERLSTILSGTEGNES